MTFAFVFLFFLYVFLFIIIFFNFLFIVFVFLVTNSGKSIESYVRGWLPRPSNYHHVVEFAANFIVPNDFGSPGAVLVTNLHGKEFYLLEIIIHGFHGGPIFFPANTWIHSHKDNPESRIIFKNQVIIYKIFTSLLCFFLLRKVLIMFSFHDIGENTGILTFTNTSRP